MINVCSVVDVLNSNIISFDKDTSLLKAAGSIFTVPPLESFLKSVECIVEATTKPTTGREGSSFGFTFGSDGPLIILIFAFRADPSLVNTSHSTEFSISKSLRLKNCFHKYEKL